MDNDVKATHAEPSKETDVMGDLRKSGYEPKENTNEFEPIKGDYLCVIDSASRLKGIGKNSGNEYDFRTIKLKVVEVIKGDKAVNRSLDMAYNLDEKGVMRLMNDLFTAGIDTKAVTSDEELDAFLETLKDKTMTVSAYKQKKMRKEGDNWVAVEPAQMVQKIRVIPKSKGTVGAATSEAAPF